MTIASATPLPSLDTTRPESSTPRSTTIVSGDDFASIACALSVFCTIVSPRTLMSYLPGTMRSCSCPSVPVVRLFDVGGEMRIANGSFRHGVNEIDAPLIGC